MEKGMVFDIQRFSLHDGPGIRTVLFLKGCSLQCRWCSNPESQLPRPEVMYTKLNCVNCGNCISVCPSNSLVPTSAGIRINYETCRACGLCVEACNTDALKLYGKEYTVEEVVLSLLKDRLYYESSGGGVTISGGEPLCQDDFIAEVLKKLKNLRIHTAVETAGSVDWQSFEKIVDYTDLFLYDIKHLQVTEHKKGTGKDNTVIISNLNKIFELEKKVIIRLPLIPEYNMGQEHISDLVRFLKGKKIDAVHLLPYHRLGIGKYEKLGKKYELSNLNPPTTEEITRIEQEIQTNLSVEVVVNG